MLRKVRDLLRRFNRTECGNLTIISAFCMVPLIGCAGLAIDYGRAVRAQSELQGIADAAVLLASSATNITCIDSDVATKQIAIAKSYLDAQLHSVANDLTVGPPVIIVEGKKISVRLTVTVKGSFLKAFGYIKHKSSPDGSTLSGDIDVSVMSQSLSATSSLSCVLAMNPTMRGAISFTGGGTLTGVNCDIRANSAHTTAISLSGGGSITAAHICSVGGGQGTRFTPAPTRCAAKVDPWASLPMPAPAQTCTAAFTNVVIKNRTANLGPGTYCGGISLQTGGIANLAPGLYIIKDGQLSTSSGSVINAPSGVTFYLTGNSSRVDIGSGSSVTLKAPTATTATTATSLYNGIAFMQDRATGVGNTNQVGSSNGITIVGAFYTPSQALSVTSNGQVNSNSPYFPVVVDTFSVGGTGELRIKLDYVTAGFAKPTGLVTNSKVHLTQ